MAHEESRADRRNLFISFTESDLRWAEWIAWQLDQAGYTVVFQHWNMLPGNDFMNEIDLALSSCRLVAVLSPEYAKAKFCRMEYHAMLNEDPSGQERLIVGVVVASGKLAPLMRSRVHVDLVNAANEEDARKKLLAAVAATAGAKPARAPPFPPLEDAGRVVGLRRFNLTEPPAFPLQTQGSRRWVLITAIVLLAVATLGGVGWERGWFAPQTARRTSGEKTTAACAQHEKGKEIIDEEREPEDRVRAIPYLEEAIRIATINIEDNLAQATDMQKRLESSNVPLPEEAQVSEDIKELIHKNWAVNDVSTCLYIKGRSLELLATKIGDPQAASKENEERLKEARAAYRTAAALTFGRCWDPSGWFWFPPKLASDRLRVLDRNGSR